ncbi:MAG: hypothetical protein H0U34_04940, partial [Sphingomonas sp.]|nr:hypothetical protein [Sphingomonas sp.]
MARPASSDANDGPMRIDPAQVRELAELLSANQLTEIEIADGDRRMRVRRDAAPAMVAAPAPAAAAAPQ